MESAQSRSMVISEFYVIRKQEKKTTLSFSRFRASADEQVRLRLNKRLNNMIAGWLLVSRMKL